MASILPSSKSIKKVRNSGDKISSLPDSVLVYILSFLPTKYAVRTSVLSLRWKHLWRSVPILDFEFTDRLRSSSHKKSSFMTFIDRVLLNHGLPCIQKLRLQCVQRIDMSRVDTWISVAIERGVQELDMQIRSKWYDQYFPWSLFTCSTLVVLKIGLPWVYDFPRTVHFPSLKILHISLYGPNNQLTQNFFCKCPVLEDLFIRSVEKPSIEDIIFDVSTPALKSLKIYSTVANGLNYSKNKILVNAPFLKYLTLEHNYLPYYFFKCPSSLVKADVNVRHCDIETQGVGENANQVFLLLKGISSFKFLTLGDFTMATIDSADDCHLPLFPNVTLLELHGHNGYGWKRLPDLLNSMPNLEYLELKMDVKKGFSHCVRILIGLNQNWCLLVCYHIFKKLKLLDFGPLS